MQENNSNEYSESEKGTRRITLIILIFLTIAGLITTFLGGFFAMFTPMAFDAPGSENNKVLYVMMFTSFAIPLVSLCSIAASWVFFFKRRYKAALFSYIPTILLLIFFAFILGMS